MPPCLAPSCVTEAGELAPFTLRESGQEQWAPLTPVQGEGSRGPESREKHAHPACELCLPRPTCRLPASCALLTRTRVLLSHHPFVRQTPGTWGSC